MFLGLFAKLEGATVSFVMSVHLFAWKNSALPEQILMKFDIELFPKILRKLKFH
jgi:hypothetical protein